MVKSRIKRTIISILISVVMVSYFLTPAVAEEKTLTMKQLYYSIWPEYDKPQVLVIYTGTFVNNTGQPFSGELEYNIPKGAQINMVCETEKGMLCQRYITKDMGDYTKVIWKPSRTIQPGEEFPVMFEYYIDYLKGQGPEKSFEHIFRPAFPIENLSVEIRQPADSSNFKLEPEPQASQNDVQSGVQFTNYYYSFTNLTPEDQLTFKVSYTRETNKPSVTTNTNTNSGGQADTASVTPVNTTVIVLLAAFLIVLAAFLVYAINANRAGTAAQSSRSKSKKRGKSGPTGKKAGGSQDKEDLKKQKRKLRQMLLDGKISEETYQQLLAELEEE
ncbi:hypothetical protein [Calderihabitans maritimus]|uniref:Uncharacterized protein n=1 Tax=Calderihabitans maritimus TaxID=1246530 RepID=A0A1Z5HWN9_9FIRM|nr:hypothetical protein [Calderihabitans maritimus]GAW93735.1 hypothetical protein Flexsi_0591 [Calderihabitans maritimus]